MDNFCLSLFVAFFLTLPLQAQYSNEQNFKKADSVASLYPGHSLKNLPELAFKLTHPLPTDIEKFRAIYKWVCENVENDGPMSQKNQRQRVKFANKPEQLQAWNQKITADLFVTLANKYKTVCTGYAYLIRELAFLTGINSKIIDGYGRTTISNIGGDGITNHSWNAVQLDGQWYLCDATWSAGFVDGTTYDFIKRYDDAYFLAEPGVFALKHYPLDTAWLIMKNKPTLNHFLNAPIAYSAAFKFGLLPASPKHLRVTTVRGEKLTFEFTGDENRNVETAGLKIEDRATSKNISVPTTRENGTLHMTHTFASKGKYDVHVMFNGEVVYSYEVTVR